MSGTINELTLKLANYLYEKHAQMNTVSFSGYMAYFTLLLLNFGLQGQAKYDLSAFLDCNYSYIEFSFEKNVFEYECISLLTIDEFYQIGSVRSAIFNSILLVESFKQMAIETYDFEFKSINPTNIADQYKTITEWTNLLKNAPYKYLFPEAYGTELEIFIFNELFIKFRWLIPANIRYSGNQIFTDINSMQYQIRMMRMIDFFGFYNDTDLKASIVFVKLELNGTYAAIVLPFVDNNIAYVLKNMNDQHFKTWFEHSEQKKIELHIPHFGIVNKISIKSFLEFYNMNNLFVYNGADFTNMVGGAGYINDIIQVSAIHINESGSHMSSPRREPIMYRKSTKIPSFYVSRPFIFYLYNSNQNLVLHFSFVKHPNY
ncbi:Serpin B13 [Thelohanellus kitauei]|uniref:Serpin B13 n=1 Tax=Thelohanellus kitauei TaxID=669202 RepID=A0A0C2NI13_THEKT|nr:Serpin B13 [Thelohanellus kitauei]